MMPLVIPGAAEMDSSRDPAGKGPPENMTAAELQQWWMRRCPGAVETDARLYATACRVVRQHGWRLAPGDDGLVLTPDQAAGKRSGGSTKERTFGAALAVIRQWLNNDLHSAASGFERECIEEDIRELDILVENAKVQHSGHSASRQGSRDRKYGSTGRREQPAIFGQPEAGRSRTADSRFDTQSSRRAPASGGEPMSSFSLWGGSDEDSAASPGIEPAGADLSGLTGALDDETEREIDAALEEMAFMFPAPGDLPDWGSGADVCLETGTETDGVCWSDDFSGSGASPQPCVTGTVPDTGTESICLGASVSGDEGLGTSPERSAEQRDDFPGSDSRSASDLLFALA